MRNLRTGPNAPAPAPASDVVTIDQAKATAGGITSGDTAGFPITISASGSYRLTSNLVVPAGVDSIQVTASNVTIDLNGFSIKGPGICSGSPGNITCTATATHGVTQAPNLRRTIVQNGTVGGFTYCMNTRYAARLADLSLHDCYSALSAFEGSMVSRVAIQSSATAGTIYASSAEQIQVWWANSAFTTYKSVLRGISMDSVVTAFAMTGNNNPLGSLAMSSIHATTLGSGVQSLGGNLYNGVAY